ncbi:MAG: V-type ATP synthase subunit A, partial [Eubacterium sp.]
LFQENKLQEMVMLVGEDALPDDQRWILQISRLLRLGFLQQNAFDDTDTYVPLEKQYQMLKIIDYLYEKGLVGLKEGIPTSVLYNEAIFDRIVKMKYNIPNEDLSGIEDIRQHIDTFYDELFKKYEA